MQKRVCAVPLSGYVTPRMPRPFHTVSTANPGFTLLEICIVLALAMMIMGIAIPTLNGVISENRLKGSFVQFDELAQDAHTRALAEHRAFVLIWAPKEIVLRPDEPANKAEADGLRKIEIAKGDVFNVYFPASLFNKRGKVTAAIWTFWPTGVCEPAKIDYHGKLGKWSATYNPFTVQGEASYD